MNYDVRVSHANVAEAFFDYIGEIALVKDFTSTMDVVMTPEEREAMEAAKNAESPEAAAAMMAGGDKATPAADAASTPASTLGGGAASPSVTATSSKRNSGSSTPASGSEMVHHSKEKAEAAERKAAKTKLTAEQKAKLEALDAEKEKERKKRIDALTEKLNQRIRPFVNAKNPSDPNDPEIKVWEQKMRTEAEDLKLESFGVEMLNTIGNVYNTRAGNFVKSKRFFGGAFLGRMKEKGGMVKEGFGLLSSA